MTDPMVEIVEQYDAALTSLEQILFGDSALRSRDALEERAAELVKRVEQSEQERDEAEAFIAGQGLSRMLDLWREARRLEAQAS